MSHGTDADAPPGGRGQRRGARALARVPAVRGAPPGARGRPRRDRRRAARGPAARRGAPAAPLAGGRRARRDRRPGRGCGVVVARRARRAARGWGRRQRAGRGPGRHALRDIGGDRGGGAVRRGGGIRRGRRAGPALRRAVKGVSSMRKRTMFLAVIAASTLGLATVHARPRFGMGAGGMMMGPGGDGPAMMLPLLLRSANLTDEQQAQVQKIMADRRAQTRALVREMRAGQAALLDKLFAAGDLKVGDLKPELDRLTRARAQLMDHAVTTALDIRKVLTPEQLARTAKIKDRMRALHDQMRDLVEPEEE